MNKNFSKLATIAFVALALPVQAVSAADKPFPSRVSTLDGAASEGFAIGKGPTAYNSSPDGSIYKVDLRSGQGEVLVDIQDPLDCLKLGMRVDDRTNYLFVAGCVYGNALVFDADNGALIMEYQLNNSGEFGLPNDLTITNDAVYFTDSYRPVLYRLPLSRNGEIPLDAGAATEIPLPAEFALDPANDPCCGGNGIVSTPDGKTLIIGHSNLARLYRLDTASGDIEQIAVDGPLAGFLDGIAMQGKTLYIMTPYDPPGPPVSIDKIQVVELDKGYLSGTLVDAITDPENLDGVASGAIFGNSLYVNNARYTIEFPPAPDTPFWITKLNITPEK
jgi:sugar lactone lactonase YvrE